MKSKITNYHYRAMVCCSLGRVYRYSTVHNLSRQIGLSGADRNGAARRKRPACSKNGRKKDRNCSGS